MAVRCVNAGCSAQLKRRIAYFASRNALEIDGLGPGKINQLVDTDMIHDVADLYTLVEAEAEVSKLERFGPRSTRNLLNAIERSKQAPAAKVLAGLSIPHVGSNAAELLIEHFSSIDALRSRGDGYH